MLQRVARPFVVVVERFYPDPFVFAIVLTALTMVLVMLAMDVSLGSAVVMWGDGLSGLLAFMAQVCLTLITAHALAHTDVLQDGICRLARGPSSAPQALVLVVLVTGLFSLVAWSLGLVAGALLAREIARQSVLRGYEIHYPLLVAAAYSGFVVWHMGYSGSAPLFVATPGHAFEDQIGVVAVTRTIFAPWNLLMAALVLSLVATMCVLMHPRSGIRRVVLPDTGDSSPDSAESTQLDAPRNWGVWLENRRILSVATGGLLSAYLVLWFVRQGLALNLNIVNWSFVALGLLLCRSPAHYMTLIGNASRAAGPILIQYPLYAGIMALMIGSDLVGSLSGFFTAISNEQTLAVWAFLCGGLVNLFVPSGGGQWVVQGPVFLDAARSLAVAPELIVMAVAYGDQWSNLIQPFWTLPLLAIAGVPMREMMGYSFVVFIGTGLAFGAGLWVIGGVW